MQKENRSYLPRVTDAIIAKKLKGLGGLMIVGPKWCGKTSTAEQFSNSAAYLDDTENGENNIKVASLNPKALLEGKTPRLIDEWQLAPTIFDAVRREIDKRKDGGQFILTGSATPPTEKKRHSGTGRFSYVRMYPMSLYESGESVGSVSLGSLFKGKPDLSTPSALSFDDLVFAIVRGGWPGTLSMNPQASLTIANEYLFSLKQNEFIYSLDHRVRRNSEKIISLIRSYARNTSTTASIETILKDTSNTGGEISRTTADSYIRELKELYVIEDQPAWNTALRSRTALRQAPKRHLIDPSLAAAAIGATSEKLLRDINTLGFMFESLCVRDMRIYASVHDAAISHYRDKTNLEVDIIIEKPDGEWGAIEVKLGNDQEEEAAANLIKLESVVDSDRRGAPSFLAIVTSGKYPYKRDDGIYVIPIGCLKP
jgi:predicted AAA+ superfamily ATPase